MIKDKNIVWHNHQVTKEERLRLKKQKATILWFTGLSGSGKSTIANAVECKLYALHRHSYLLDGDNIRLGLNRDLGFSNEDRVENIRRIAEVSKLFVDAGVIVLTAFISPFREDRESVRSLVEDGEFIEIFVDTPLDICESRDPKGLYAKVRKGEIPNFTGISSVYESPLNSDIYIRSDLKSLDECAQEIIDYLKSRGYLDATRD